MAVTSKTMTANDAAAENVDDATGVGDQNARLEHSQSGATTRDDVTDLGVPMLQGDPKEPQGPEDAAAGPTRGDYSGRVGEASYQPHTSVPIEDPEAGGPRVRMVAQRPIFSETKEVPRKKGGVDVLSEVYDTSSGGTS